MTPEQIALVQGSFKKVAAISGPAADIFYDKLFEIAPQVRPLFPEEMGDQKKKLMQMIAIAVNGLTKLDEILPAVQDLGRRHNDYKVEPAHYDFVGEALIYALGQGLGEAFTDEVKAAWVETYGILAGVMIDAQKEAVSV
ncbi:MAG: globin domain-containing protein [Pelagimonas sp.]|jgi:hemoglobin-like flavoprotein|nr:globin domain-containing protein [Pelagimonas sp.]